MSSFVELSKLESIIANGMTYTLLDSGDFSPATHTATFVRATGNLGNHLLSAMGAHFVLRPVDGNEDDGPGSVTVIPVSAATLVFQAG